MVVHVCCHTVSHLRSDMGILSILVHSVIGFSACQSDVSQAIVPLSKGGALDCRFQMSGREVHILENEVCVSGSVSVFAKESVQEEVDLKVIVLLVHLVVAHL